MALLKAGKGPLRMDLIDDDLTGTVSGNSTHIRITFGDGWYNDFYGAFQFDQFGRITGGTLSGVDYTLDDKLVYALTEAATPAKSFFDLVGAGRADLARELVLSGDDTLIGKSRNDYLEGYAGNDRIKANDGTDVLVGGLGADKLEGGAGADTFLYFSAAESTLAVAGRDRILDFSAADGDRIDISAIGTSAGVAFHVVEGFSKVAGEVLITKANGGYLVRADVDGNGKADFAITVLTDGPLSAADFMF